MKFDHIDLARVLYREIILNDSYQLRHIDRTKVQYVFDVGANVGLFSMMARFLFPEATIYALEPAPSTCELLIENTANLNILVIQTGLGKLGDTLALQKQGPNSGQNQYRAISRDQDGIRAMGLAEMIGACDPAATIVKVDTEGAEMSIINDPTVIPLLRRLLCFTAEFHFGESFGTPGWKEVYEPWTKEVFAKTHDTSVTWKSSHYRKTNAFTAHLNPRK